MKKKVGILIVLLLLIAATLCACGSSGGDKKQEDKKTDNSWEKTELAPYNIYTQFLGGFTSIASEFSTAKLKGNNKISLDSKMEVEVNDNDFWATLKLNYDNADKSQAMGAFELTSKEDSYDDLVFGSYYYKEVVYMAFGSTRFSIPMSSERWSPFFPFDLGTIDNSKAAAALGLVVVNKAAPEVKKRQNGLNEEYNIVLNIDVAASIKRLIVEYFDKEKSDQAALKGVEEICYSVFGLTLGDIREGRFPDSSLKLDFTTSNLKLSALKLKAEVEASGKSTLLDGDDIELEVDLQKFEISKTNTSIPFVNDNFKTERDKYVSFLDSTFQFVSENSTKIDGVKKDYEMAITAKIFQEPRTDNYAFMEYKDKATNELVMAGYIYKDIAYIYKRVGDEWKCTVSLPLNISDVANDVVANNYTPKPEANILSIIGYVFGAIRVGQNGVSFVVDKDLYNIVWYNFNAAIASINASIEEDIFEDDDVNEFKNFVTEKDWVVNLKYDQPFITIVQDNTTLQASIENSTPDKVFEAKSEAQGEAND